MMNDTFPLNDFAFHAGSQHEFSRYMVLLASAGLLKIAVPLLYFLSSFPAHEQVLCLLTLLYSEATGRAGHMQ